MCGFPFLKSINSVRVQTILNSGPSRAHLSYFCSYANLPVIVEATHRHSNSSVRINVPSPQQFLFPACQHPLAAMVSLKRPPNTHYGTHGRCLFVQPESYGHADKVISLMMKY